MLVVVVVVAVVVVLVVVVVIIVVSVPDLVIFASMKATTMYSWFRDI